MDTLTIKCLSYAAMGTLAMATILPMTAQATPYSVTCQAVIPVNQGASLIYRVTGNVSAPTAIATPQNPIGTTLRLSVQRRDRNGSIQTVLSASSLADYEQLAPDADYSQIPFDRAFRAQPNNGDRLYVAPASVHGLYASLRPINGQPQQIQIVHYLSAGRSVRSAAGACTVAAT